MKWMVIENQRGEQHIVPDDGIQHLYYSRCWCDPDKEYADDGDEMVVHHAKEKPYA
jgi:hypothetical protein